MLHSSDSQARSWAMLCHFGSLAGYFIPLGNILVPWLLWRRRRARSSFLDHQGKEAVNFQLSLTLYLAVAFVLGLACRMAGATDLGTLLQLGPGVLIALTVTHVALALTGAVQSQDGQLFRYPLTIRFIR